MAYRGDGEASAERLAALDEEIARLEARLTPVFWERVAAAWRVPRELSPALGPLEARHERIAAIEAGIERAKTGPFAEPELPELPPPSTGLLSAVEQALYVGEVYDGVRSAMRVHAPDAELEYRGHGVRGVRSSVDGAPIDLQVLLERGGDRSRMVLEGTTTVVPSARLGLKPEGILQDLLEMLGFSEEIELGDPSFDPVFLISGDEPTARAFLTGPLKRAILAISEEAGARVTIAGGLARLRSGSISHRATTRVLEVLAAWHALPSPHPLLAAP
ncbi:MAG: hypothetical protein KC619_31735 [Myxococcales bacterium]|nr:hypothetical protein [Myxococcales bacterium]